MYSKSHKKEQIKQVCELCGMKYVWFQHLVLGLGKISLDLAMKLEAATRVKAQRKGDYITVLEVIDIDKQVAELVVKYHAEQLRRSGG